MREAEAKMAALVPDLARELGWQVHRQGDHYGTLLAPEGWTMGVSVGYEGTRGRGCFVLCGCLPRTKSGDVVWLEGGRLPPVIKVPLDRRAKLVAADVRRRLLPEFEPLWVEAQVSLAEQDSRDRESDKESRTRSEGGRR